MLVRINRLILIGLGILGIITMGAHSGRSPNRIRLYKAPPCELDPCPYIWHKADAIALNDGDLTNRWIDSSGNGLHSYQGDTAAFGPQYSNSVINGKPAFTFHLRNPAGAGDFFILSNGAFATASQLEAFVLLKGETNALIESDGPWCLGGADGSSHYRFTDGKCYDGAGSTTRKTTVAFGDTVTNWHVYHVSSKSSAWTNYLDNVAKFGTAVNTVGFNGPSGATNTIGVGDKGPPIYYSPFGGWIAEFFVYTNTLTALQRSNCFWYLTNKYALGGLP